MSREQDDEELKEIWVYKLSSKPLTSVDKSLLQKGPTFSISLSSTPIIDYITATKHICNLIGENNLFGKHDCTEYYDKVKEVLTKFRTTPKTP